MLLLIQIAKFTAGGIAASSSSLLSFISIFIHCSAGGVNFGTIAFAVLAEWLREQQLREPASQLPSLLATSPRSANVNKPENQDEDAL